MPFPLPPSDDELQRLRECIQAEEERLRRFAEATTEQLERAFGLAESRFKGDPLTDLDSFLNEVSKALNEID